MEEIEHEVDKRPGVTSVRSVLDQAERGGAVGPDTAQLPVEMACRVGSNAIAAPIAGYLFVQSSPVRVSNRTKPRSSRACIRKRRI